MPDPEIQITSDLLVITPRGTASRAMISALVQQHYPNLGERSILWDFSGADVSQINREDLDAIAAGARQVLSPGVSRKIGYVVSDSGAYVKACKYFNAAVAAGLPAEYAVFTTRAAAEQWLKAQ